MKPRITYTPTTNNGVLVFLDGRRVGNIHFDVLSQTYRYFPKGQTTGGEAFKSLALVKASLEAE
jgi:hypothetical protein